MNCHVDLCLAYLGFWVRRRGREFPQCGDCPNTTGRKRSLAGLSLRPLPPIHFLVSQSSSRKLLVVGRKMSWLRCSLFHPLFFGRIGDRCGLFEPVLSRCDGQRESLVRFPGWVGDPIWLLSLGMVVGVFLPRRRPIFHGGRGILLPGLSENSLALSPCRSVVRFGRRNLMFAVLIARCLLGSILCLPW